MPAAPETLKALEEARASAERAFHAYAGASSKAASKQARDLFGRLAAWEMHHFEEIDRASIAQSELGAWVDYVPGDFEKLDPKFSDRKDTWDRSGAQYFNEMEALASAIENERACYSAFLGLAAKAKEARERDYWTAIASEEDLHAKVLKEQLEGLKVDGKWTWLEVLAKGAPKASFAATRMAVSMIAPLSTSELPQHKVKTPGETRGEIETALLPPGWERMSPEKTAQYREVAWVPPPIADPMTPKPGSIPPATAAAPGGGWVPMEAPKKPEAAQGGAWIPMGAEVAQPPKPKTEPPKVRFKPPTTVRHVGKVTEPPPGRPPGPTDTAIMDRPLAHTGGRWVYEASVRTAAQLAAPNPPPSEDCLALISGPCRRAFLDILNRRGAQGWELLQLGFHKDTVVLFWKRRE